MHNHETSAETLQKLSILTIRQEHKLGSKLTPCFCNLEFLKNFCAKLDNWGDIHLNEIPDNIAFTIYTKSGTSYKLCLSKNNAHENRALLIRGAA